MMRERLSMSGSIGSYRLCFSLDSRCSNHLEQHTGARYRSREVSLS
jgi:hypothetical protein